MFNSCTSVHSLIYKKGSGFVKVGYTPDLQFYALNSCKFRFVFQILLQNVK